MLLIAEGSIAFLIGVLIICIHHFSMDPFYFDLVGGLMAVAGAGMVVAGVYEHKEAKATKQAPPAAWPEGPAATL